VGLERSDVGSVQVGYITWLWSVVMWAVSNLGGDIAWVCSVVMWAVSKWVVYNVVMESSVVGSDLVGVYIAWVWFVVIWAVSILGDIFWVWSVVMWAVS